VLRRTLALPSLLLFLSYRGLNPVDEQPIAFASALTAYTSSANSGATTSLARNGEFLLV
jgi:hypothetical protein